MGFRAKIVSVVRVRASSRGVAAALSLCVSAGGLFLSSAPALGAQTRKLVNTFGGVSSVVPDPYPLSSPQGEAVDQETGDVYVADTGNHRLEKFSATGELLLAFGANVGGIGEDVCGLVPCLPGSEGSAPGEFTTPRFLAVDQTTGNVYVADTGDDRVSKFNSEGVLEKTWGTEGQLTGSATAWGSFHSLAGIAVGQTGTLYVVSFTPSFPCWEEEACRTFEFEPGGGLTKEFGMGDYGAVGAAVDAAGNLFEGGEGGHIERLDAADEATSNVINAEPASAFTIDPATGELYVAGRSDTLTQYAFNGEGNVIEPGGAKPCPATSSDGCPATTSVAIPFAASGIAVASGGADVFVSNAYEGSVYEYGGPLPIPEVEAGSASEIKPRSARLNWNVNPDGVVLTQCEFEYVEAGDYEPEAPDPYTAGKAVPCAEGLGEGPGEVGKGTEPVAVHAEINGLTSGVIYHFRLRTADENGPAKPGLDASFETLPPPSIDSATATALTATSATLNAKIKPQFSETHYHFEYDIKPYQAGEAPHGVRIPTHEAEDPSLALSASDVFVSAPIGGLSANTTFYWRVAASNESGTTESRQHTFIYDTSGGGLPDKRAYELVTPSHKNAALFGENPFPFLQTSIAADGQRVFASTLQCFAGAESCNASLFDSVGSPVEFTRTSGGWVTTPLAPPAPQFAQLASWWGYSASTGTALLSTPTVQSGENDFYLREPDGSFVDIGPNTPPEQGAQGPKGLAIGDKVQVSSADLSHFAWESRSSELTAPWPFEPNAGYETAYEYASVGNVVPEHPLLVGVSGGKDSHSLISACATHLGGPLEDPRGTMSSDGHTVFFTASGPCESGTNENAGKPVPADTLYARVSGELLEASTVAISDPSPSECGTGTEPDEVSCREATPANAQFMGASEDGSKAFFTSEQQLTDEATEGSNNLYLYDLDSPEGHNLLDLSAGDSSGEGPRVQGVMAISPDGSHVYFVAKGVLSTPANDLGESAKSGANNLYVFERDQAYPAGRVAFIAELPARDSLEWREGSQANVTPGGRFLVFVSFGDLTADDTSVSGALQVFRYDAQTGQLNRVSVGNEGFGDDGNRPSPTPCGQRFTEQCSENAYIVPALAGVRADPTMSDDGSRVFFQSPVGLAPHALYDVQIGVETDGQPVYAQNVYEWEQEGVGSCPAGRATGCVSLISDGRDVSFVAVPVACGGRGAGVCLLGTDETGANVFFTTADQLVPADGNTEIDYYDARICEPEKGNPCIESAPASPPCAGEGCHDAPTGAPEALAAPTATFYGQGNVVASEHVKAAKKKTTCKPALVKRKRRCAKQSTKTKAAKRASRGRRDHRHGKRQ